ncbi:hypothetical protein V1J52_10790 [Streptomyces sp. TRM 70351]|uniref:hypothetical protein n=1 Tax=Streptomyces sp. TRM 70351 TaxID=3116552 RepID=UPI002E7B7D75|nr:hypothetical protein [Streptomyces sp. TRM 70351]MEE1928676.1 hypothetical protein [Streptomyces sp. TRM 70351]
MTERTTDPGTAPAPDATPAFSDPKASPAPEPESLAELRGDCSRMSGRWADRPRHAAAPPEPLHGVRVPDGSARLLDGMSEYGD